MSNWFATFFRFPVLVFKVEPLILLIAVVVMLGSAAVGALGALRTVVTLAPTVAMTPPAPSYRATWFDRAIIAARIHAPIVRMVARSVTRRPVRSLLAAGGMSLAIAIVVFGGFTADALARVIDVRFQHQERQDLSVVLTRAGSLERWREFETLPAVRIAEPYRAVLARLRTAAQVQDVTLIGLRSPTRLRTLMDMSYGRMSVPLNGIVMSSWLARQGRVSRGDTVALEIREGRRRIVTTHVVALLDEPLGTYVYADLYALGRLLDEPNTFSGVNVLLDPTRSGELFALLKRAPQVLGVEFRRDSIANFRSMGDDTVAFIRQIELVFAVIIAVGVVYNTARIAVAERTYELATLRVLGFTRREISTILLGEIGALAALAIPVGCALGYLLSAWLSGALSSELFRFPMVLAPRTYAFAIGVFVIASAASALVVRRHLDRLDLVAVLKARE